MYYLGGDIFLAEEPVTTLAPTVADEIIASFPPAAGWHIRGVGLSWTPPHDQLRSAAEIADFWVQHPGTQVTWGQEGFIFNVNLTFPAIGYRGIEITYNKKTALLIANEEQQVGVRPFRVLWPALCERTHAIGGFLSKWSIEHGPDEPDVIEDFFAALKQRDPLLAFEKLPTCDTIYLGAQMLTPDTTKATTLEAQRWGMQVTSLSSGSLFMTNWHTS